MNAFRSIFNNSDGSVGTYMWWNCCMADLAEIGGSGSKMVQNLFSYAPKGFLVKYNEHEESLGQ